MRVFKLNENRCNPKEIFDAGTLLNGDIVLVEHKKQTVMGTVELVTPSNEEDKVLIKIKPF